MPASYFGGGQSLARGRRRDPRVPDQRLRTIARGVAVFVVVDFVAAAVAPRGLLDVVLTTLVPTVPLVGVLAYRRAPDQLRRLWALLTASSICLLVGTVLWFASYRADGYRIPKTPGVWDVAFLASYALTVAGVLTAMRGVIALRHALTDATVVCSAGLAIGAVFAGRGLVGDVSASSLATLVRPAFGIVVLTLIVSAALGSWEGLPLSTILQAPAQVCWTAGSFVYAYAAVQGRFVDDRLADAFWVAGAAIGMLGAVAIILDTDRPVRPVVRERIPGHRPGATLFVAVASAALLSTVGAVVYGLVRDVRPSVVVGLATTVAVSAALALRARNSIGEVERAYVRLDHAHAQLERTRDSLEATNTELAEANVEVRMMQIAFADLLNLVDERTSGGMTELIEQAGAELAALLEEHRRTPPGEAD